MSEAPNPLPVWFEPAAEIACGIAPKGTKRPKGEPKPAPDWAVKDWATWRDWNKWIEAGKPTPRPPFLWRTSAPATEVPPWAWSLRAKWLKVHPRPKPAPGPQPQPERVSPWKNPPWSGIGLHVAWAFTAGQYTVEQLVDRIAGTRVSFVAFEGSPAMGNEPYIQSFRDGLHAHGRRLLLWERDDTQKEYPEPRLEHVKRMIDTYQPDAYGADIETFPIDDPTFPETVAKAYPKLPRITLVPGQPDASQLKTWFDNGWDMMSQDYAANIGQPPVPGIAGPCDHDAFWRGCTRNFVPAPKGWGGEWWQHGTGPHTVPIIEVNAEGNPGLGVQLEADAVKWFGGNWSVWLAELLTDDDWSVLGG